MTAGIASTLLAAILIAGCTTPQLKLKDSSAKHVPIGSSHYHEYGVFFGTFATPCSVASRLNGVPLDPKGCDQRNQRAFVIGQEGGIAPLSIDETNWWQSNGDNSNVNGESPYSRERYRLLSNPLTHEPFPKNTLYFAPAHVNTFKEVARVVLATTIGSGASPNTYEIAGHRFRFIICHSNGCTEAMRLLKHGAIWSDHLIHDGSPWAGTVTFLPNTVSATFVLSGDLVPLLNILRFLHLPEIELERATYQHKYDLEGKRDASAPLVFIGRDKNEVAFGSHGLGVYFDALEEWVKRAKTFVDSDMPLESAPTELSDFFGTKGGPESLQVRYGIPWLARGWEEYRGFNLQDGVADCSGTSKNDCFGKTYANYKYARHQFRGSGSARISIKECVDKTLDERDADNPSYQEEALSSIQACIASSPLME